jgi:hypothetical protein
MPCAAYLARVAGAAARMLDAINQNGFQVAVGVNLR